MERKLRLLAQEEQRAHMNAWLQPNIPLTILRTGKTSAGPLRARYGNHPVPSHPLPVKVDRGRNSAYISQTKGSGDEPSLSSIATKPAASSEPRACHCRPPPLPGS
jgi:hypothetical protein